MRSLEEILRTYNIVNSRSVSRYTVRFTAVLLLAGVGVVAGSMLITGGLEDGRVPGDRIAAQDDGANGAPGDEGDSGSTDPFVIQVLEGADWVYIGYPLDGYDSDHADRYATSTVDIAVIEWLAGHPTRIAETPYERILDPEGEGHTMGYLIRLR